MTTMHPYPLLAGPYICNLQFTDDTDLMGSRNGELQDLTNRLIDRASRARANGIKVSIEKSKIQTSSSNNSANIMNGQRFQKVTSCKYLGTIPCKDDTCSAEICIRIDSAVTAMARLNRIW